MPAFPNFKPRAWVRTAELGLAEDLGRLTLTPGSKLPPFPLLPSGSCASPQRIRAGGIWRWVQGSVVASQLLQQPWLQLLFRLLAETALGSAVWPREGSHISCARGSSASRTSRPPKLPGPQTTGWHCKASSYLSFAEDGRNRRPRKYRAPHSCRALAASLASRFLKLKSNISPQRAV